MGGRVEPEVAAVAGEADAERHLARRRCGELAVHRGRRDEGPSVYLPTEIWFGSLLRRGRELRRRPELGPEMGARLGRLLLGCSDASGLAV